MISEKKQNYKSNMQRTTNKGNRPNQTPLSSSQLQENLNKMVGLFWGNNPYIKDAKNNHELEVRFGTMGKRTFSKIDYDNVVRKLKSLGFQSENEEGNYMLRINNEFLNPKTGTFEQSNIRTEINGFMGIQEYCKHNNINKLLENYTTSNQIKFYAKSTYKHGDDRVFPVDFRDFNFRVAYDMEETLHRGVGKIKYMLDGWENAKKTFRYINRVTFIHPELPVKADISIVKSSVYDNDLRRMVSTYTTEESGVFTSPEVYDIELEVDNTNIGPGTLTPDLETLLTGLRKAIKYILMGLQNSNYPISYKEQEEVLTEYNKCILGNEYNPEKHKWPRFIGPDSYTLQIPNISPINENTTIPNIRNDYTVTDKADGERYMMFIGSKGKIYFINKNMQVVFSGAVSENEEVFDTLLDGEIILHDKYGKYINLYAAFDLYFRNKQDKRSFGFMPRNKDDNISKFRLPLLKSVISNLKLKSIVPGDKSPLRVESKKFYPTRIEDSIFSACNYILGKENEGLYEYNTDGLIFTPASMGVGADKIGVAGPLKKIVWEHSFKWKPPQFNTIDFLVKTVKTAAGADQVTPLFQPGIDASANVQLNEYKSLVLCVGFNPNQHGYINPCQDVIEDKLPHFKDMDDEDKYRPAEFVPTNPADPNAGLCNIMLRKDATGVSQMFTEEDEVFEDDTIVEFRYDMDKDAKWRWIPLRVRYDKTTRYRQTGTEIGNAYHVANSNWYSIHNPITQEMISTGINIPDEIADDDIYYDRVTTTTKTRGLRDFHNLFVKKLLITSVSKKGDILIDYACGKGGDFPKWINANLSFVFGIDISKDNLENRLNGACARFLNFRKKFKHIPYALFVNGDSSVNIRNGTALKNDKAIQITNAVFGEGVKDEDKLGKGVYRQYGKAVDGFNVSSCQFALHYFFRTPATFQNFIRNVSECTKIGGYFIGACYDGQNLFNLLKQKKAGESISLYDSGTKIWELRKDYENEEFNDDISCIGYQISVYQESISNKKIPEYLVNFDYLNRIMEDYGFKLVTRDESKDLGLPDGSGLFNELYNSMEEEIRRDKYKAQEYGDALKMNANERKISFLNRYFVYKKIRNVNAEKITLDQLDEEAEELLTDKVIEPIKEVEKLKTTKKSVSKTSEEKITSTKKKSTEKESVETEKKSRVRKLKSKIVLENNDVEPQSVSNIELPVVIETEKIPQDDTELPIIIEKEDIVPETIPVIEIKPIKKRKSTKKLDIVDEIAIPTQSIVVEKKKTTRKKKIILEE